MKHTSHRNSEFIKIFKGATTMQNCSRFPSESQNGPEGQPGASSSPSFQGQPIHLHIYPHSTTANYTISNVLSPSRPRNQNVQTSYGPVSNIAQSFFFPNMQPPAHNAGGDTQNTGMLGYNEPNRRPNQREMGNNSVSQVVDARQSLQPTEFRSTAPMQSSPTEAFTPSAHPIPYQSVPNVNAAPTRLNSFAQPFSSPHSPTQNVNDQSILGYTHSMPSPERVPMTHYSQFLSQFCSGLRSQGFSNSDILRWVQNSLGVDSTNASPVSTQNAPPSLPTGQMTGSLTAYVDQRPAILRELLSSAGIQNGVADRDDASSSRENNNHLQIGLALTEPTVSIPSTESDIQSTSMNAIFPPSTRANTRNGFVDDLDVRIATPGKAIPRIEAKQFVTFADLKSYVEMHSEMYGYELSTVKSVNKRAHELQGKVHQNSPCTSELRTVIWKCKSNWTNRMEMDTAKGSGQIARDCEFRLVASWYSRYGGIWKLNVDAAIHNHPQNFEGRLRKTASRLPIHVRETIWKWIEEGFTTPSIMNRLEERFPNLRVTEHFIDVERKAWRYATYHGPDRVRSTLKYLMDHGFRVYYKRNSRNELVALMCIHKQSMRMANAFNSVVFIDDNYRTKQHYMPLLNIVGFSNVYTTFNIAFALLPGENEEDVIWALTILKGVYEPDRVPEVFATDRELTCTKALMRVFGPNTKLVPCIWRANKEIVEYVSRKMRAKEPRDRILHGWDSVVSALTEERAKAQMTKFLDHLDKDPIVIEYLAKYWLQNKESIFQSFRSMLHICVRTISQEEGRDGLFEAESVSRHENIHIVSRAIAPYIQYQLKVYHDTVQMQLRQFPKKYKDIRFFYGVGKRVSHKCLDFLYEQYQIAEGLIVGKVAKECTGYTRESLGIPCAHEMFNYMRGEWRPIPLKEIHIQWHLNNPYLDERRPICSEVNNASNAPWVTAFESRVDTNATLVNTVQDAATLESEENNAELATADEDSYSYSYSHEDSFYGLGTDSEEELDRIAMTEDEYTTDFSASGPYGEGSGLSSCAISDSIPPSLDEAYDDNAVSLYDAPIGTNMPFANPVPEPDCANTNAAPAGSNAVPAEPAAASMVEPVLKKRGRKPKNQTDTDSAIEPTPKKRGRKTKNETDTASKLPDMTVELTEEILLSLTQLRMPGTRIGRSKSRKK